MQDAEIGTFYNYFRNYDRGQGRYIQSDPIGLGGGLSRFVYSSANSLRYSDPQGRSGVAFFGGGDLTVGAGGTAGSGGYYTFDTGQAGAATFTGQTFGLSGGLGTSITFFGGSGTSLLEGQSTNYNVTVLDLSFGVSFSSKLSDGLLGITAVTVGVGAGLPVGGNVSTTTTIIQTAGTICRGR